MDETCPFCAFETNIENSQLPSNELAYIRLDGFPVSHGHLLIIPRRHVPDWFSLQFEEKEAIMRLVDEGKNWLEEHYHPDGYNIGMNCGQVAGQTVAHMHCHLIPRYKDDVADPRGGVRWVIPEKADYWSES